MNATSAKLIGFARRNWRGVARFLLIFAIAQILAHVIPHPHTL